VSESLGTGSPSNSIFLSGTSSSKLDAAIERA
jgi:hypothetical protein